MGDTLVLRGTTALRSVRAVRGSTVVPIGVTGRAVEVYRRPPVTRSTTPEGTSGPVMSNPVMSGPVMSNLVMVRPEPEPGPVPTTPLAGSRSRITLTRRGRFLLVGLPVALGIASLIFLGAFLTSSVQAGEGPAQSSPTISVTVGAGETLWGLASRHAPDRDTRDVVAEMIELNNLRSSVVQAGQDISIPTRG
jgi:LysM repeat protein